MDWKISFYYILPATFILLLIFPVVFETRVSFNPLFNRGVVALFLFKKNVYCIMFCLKGKAVEILNQQNDKTKHIDFSSPEFAIMKEFGNQLKDKVRLKKCYVFYNIGTGDAFSSAILCGTLNQILTQIFAYVKSQKPTASFCVYDTVSYNKESCEFALRMQISISVFEVAYSYLYSVIINKRK